MRIQQQNFLNFKRRLTSSEEADFYATLQKGKEKIGNTGHTALIIPSPSLPQEYNTGVGHFLDKEGIKFLDFAKQYWGINTIQLLPEGNYGVRREGIFLPYSGSSFSLGDQLINLELLTKDEYAKLLSKEDLKNILSRQENKVDFENVLLEKSPVDNVLRNAYKELLKSDTEEKKQLLEKINIYSKENKEWIEPKALYKIFTEKNGTKYFNDWNSKERDLYNEKIVSVKEREKIIETLKTSGFREEFGFEEFKQFIAEDHLAKTRKMLNDKGMKLSGDMLVGFSREEVWSNPNAFYNDATMKWSFPALNFETEEGMNLFRSKINKFAKRYDGFRIDAAWIYSLQPLYFESKNEWIRKDFGSELLNVIEDEVLKVKGQNYNLENITYEFIAHSNDFSTHDQNGLKDFLKNKTKTITSYNCSDNWGTVSAFKNQGWKDGSYILGATNHDSRPLRQEFKELLGVKGQISALSKIFNIPIEKLNNEREFVQAKLAEPMRSKHNMIFFTEALNIADRYKDNLNRAEDYRVKISKNYQDEYFKTLEKGEGFNIMDALEKNFVAEGLDKKEPELYKKIQKYNKILKSLDKNNKFAKVAIIASGVVLLLSLGVYYLIKNMKKEKLMNKAS